MHPHFAADGSNNFVPVLKPHPEHGITQCLGNCAVLFNKLLLCHLIWECKNTNKIEFFLLIFNEGFVSSKAGVMLCKSVPLSVEKPIQTTLVDGNRLKVLAKSPKLYID
jgi:hypothetical protein